MSRTFQARTTEFGTDVVDDHGTRYAAFDADNPKAEILGGYMLGLIRRAYEIGLGETDRSAEIAAHRARSGDGRPTWDVRIGGDSIGSVGRTTLQMSPPGGVRSMVRIARDVYAVARADMGAAPAYGM